jgi:hypothetical protein
VREALEMALAGNTRARGYILDDQGALRQHMVIFVNGAQIKDREGCPTRCLRTTHRAT